MIIYGTDLQQDTVPRKNVINQDSTRVKPDSASTTLSLQSKDSVQHKIIIIPQKTVVDNTDTTSVCSRNIIADVTFYDSENIILKIK